MTQEAATQAETAPNPFQQHMHIIQEKPRKLCQATQSKKTWRDHINGHQPQRAMHDTSMPSKTKHRSQQNHPKRTNKPDEISHPKALDEMHLPI